MTAINVKNLKVNYEVTNSENKVLSCKKVLDDISFSIEEGEFICILGKNGSGKSTLAKCFNGLVKPTSGEVLIYGLNTNDDNVIINIRKKIGMTFQNPDNQIVASIVEEDIAFGLENLGISSEEMRKNIDEVMDKLNINSLRHMTTSKLSGGQKQKISIAGVLAMKPKIIVLDEPTSMIDKVGRVEILELAKKLNKESGITIILISHYLEEISYADRVILLNSGKIIIDDSPENILLHSEELYNAGLDMPYIPKLATELRNNGKELKGNEMTVDELCQYLK